MFENDFPLLSTASLVALILHKAAAGPVSLDSCDAALAALFQQADEKPGLPPEELRGRLAGHLSDLETARILEPAQNGSWQLTRRGRQALRQHPEGLDQTDLARYPEFAAHLRDTAHHACGMDPRQDRFDEGFQACMKGQPFTANPYAFDNADHQAWESGWTEAQEDRQG
ncbi:ribosome modulation factor [Leisingera methylohalidivorans]|uniref:Restriction system protein Mrr-like N-terminal domain-containing protein n=1 Tax=Leisingera methylohalidivorans DSM 14336 TaxID=999552 RepID=V9VZ35_9RHOB|nr:hypothetical protein [Leisingera methylohalidivorans]AHD03034.1 hypothetical protein METH_09200 [Leisingera methylohalidivorans DSM 14336]